MIEFIPNVENLKKMAEYIATIPQKSFDMTSFRSGHKTLHACESIGCVIGHCTILEQEELPRFSTGVIDFADWSRDFTGIPTGTREWEWCFSHKWAVSDNTPIGASRRILYYLEHGLPKNWVQQLHGEDLLIYHIGFNVTIDVPSDSVILDAKA